jgi:hypothetical protein
MTKQILQATDSDLEAVKFEVVNLLNQFMMEMKQWELSCLEELKDLDFESDELTIKEMKFRLALENIHKKYCTAKKRKRNRIGSYGFPTNYDPVIEKVIDVVMENRNRIVALSQRDIGIKIQYKYVVLRRNQKWLIDNRQRLNQNGRWQRNVL